MITNIILQNFKCFRSVRVAPKLITVLIGPNGTGKSAVLQALSLLKQSRANISNLELSGGMVQFASEALMLHGHESGLDTVGFSLSWQSTIDSEEAQGPVKFEADLQYSRHAKLSLYRGSTKWCSEGQEYKLSFDQSGHQRRTSTPRGYINYETSPQINGFRIGATSGGEVASRPFWEQLAHAPTKALAGLKMVPAARGLTQGVYALGPNYSDDISSTRGLGAQEDSTATTLAYSRPDVERVSKLMKRITGVGFRVDTVPPQSAKPVSESLVGDLTLMAEGFGTNALVQLLFEIVRAAPMSTVLLEEPEIHLHPRAQADLASVLVEEAKTCQKQIVMTTHSEHIAGRLLTLVAEGTLSPDELAVYSFEKDKTGVCSATEIEVTDRGQVNGGLKSFFETDLDEMRRYVDALRAKA